MNTKTGFWGFVLGGLVGATFALLYAPQSGEETRKILLENSQQAKEDAMNSLQETQDTTLAKIYQYSAILNYKLKYVQGLRSQITCRMHYLLMARAVASKCDKRL